MGMPIQFQCTCGKQVQAPDNMAGKRVRCPYCQAVNNVPQAIMDAEEIVRPSAPVAPKPMAPERNPFAFGGSNEPEPSAPDTGGDSRRPCPMCGEMILASAAKCRY